MILELLLLALCLSGWLGALRLFTMRRSFYTLFGLIIMSLWLYASVGILLVALGVSFEVLLIFGLLPLLCVAYGYRIYEHRMKEKVKRDSGAGKMQHTAEDRTH